MANGRYNFQRLKQVDPLWGSILGMENNIIKFWNDQPEKHEKTISRAIGIFW